MCIRDSIIASGNNANVLHYIENNQQCKAGDLILLDVGAEYANYSSDMTRMVPVSGRFSDRQKEVYNAVSVSYTHLDVYKRQIYFLPFKTFIN